MGLGTSRPSRDRVHGRRTRQERGGVDPVRAPAAAASRGTRDPRGQRLLGRDSGAGAADRRQRARPGETRGAPLSVLGFALRSGASGDADGLGAQPHLLLQLGVLACADDLRVEVGRRHGAHRCGCRGDTGAGLAARVGRVHRHDAALPAVRRQRAHRIPRSVAGEPRTVGMAQPKGLRAHQGIRVGAVAVASLTARLVVARLVVCGAQAPQRGRVRPLVQRGLRHLVADASQAP